MAANTDSIKAKLDEGFRNERWTAVPVEPHLGYLMTICRLRGNKTGITQALFGDTPSGSAYGQEIWARLNLLVKLNLLFVERDFQRVVDFHVHPDLPRVMQAMHPTLYSGLEGQQPRAQVIHRIEVGGPIRSLEDGGRFRLDESITLQHSRTYQFKIEAQPDGSRVITIVMLDRPPGGR